MSYEVLKVKTKEMHKRGKGGNENVYYTNL